VDDIGAYLDWPGCARQQRARCPSGGSSTGPGHHWRGRGMRHLSELLDASAALHQHLCPRQVLGVRLGMLAGQLFELDLPQTDKRLLAIVETDGCAADGIAVAAGCWVGRRTLRVEDYGKVAATFADTETGRTLRIAPSGGPQPGRALRARGTGSMGSPAARLPAHPRPRAVRLAAGRTGDADHRDREPRRAAHGLRALWRGDHQPARGPIGWTDALPRLCRRGVLRPRRRNRPGIGTGAMTAGTAKRHRLPTMGNPT